MATIGASEAEGETAAPSKFSVNLVSWLDNFALQRSLPCEIDVSGGFSKIRFGRAMDERQTVRAYRGSAS